MRSAFPGVSTSVFSGGLSVLVHFALGELCQGLVRLLFLGKGRVQELHGLLQPEFLRPGLQRAVASDLVMFDSLRRREEPGIKCRRAP